MTDDRMEWIIREYESTDITKFALCEKYGISRPTLDRWLKDRQIEKIGGRRVRNLDIAYISDEDVITIVQGNIVISIPRVKFMERLYTMFTFGLRTDFTDYSGKEHSFKILLE